MSLRLVTIPISHFCEKARWTLERAGLAYEEQGHVPGLHMLPAGRWARQRTVPVLVHPSGVLRESGAILRWIDERCDAGLYPRERRREVEQLEARLDDELGPATRLFFYHHVLAERAIMLRLFAQGVPTWQARLLPGMYPVMRRVIAHRYGVSVEAAMHARETVLRVFDDVARALDGRRYLVGDSFTAADLTFAALCGPVLLPRGYGIDLGDPAALPRPFALQVQAFREHPAGELALRFYREERSR